MKLSQISKLFNTNITSEIEVTSISYDSRSVKPGDIFVCLVGEKNDGHNYVDEVLLKGAVAIIAAKKINSSAPVIYVNDTQVAIAKLASFFYGEPSKDIRIIGVTGTNGKTTTTHLIQHILETNSNKTAVIGTLGTRESTTSPYYDAKHTTPQAPELQKNISDLVNKNFKYLAMEVSSHALELHRVDYTNFSCSVLTNLTQDHLDFHITMDNYWKAKSKLFTMLGVSEQKNISAILNADDKYFERFKNVIPSSVRTLLYGIINKADFKAENIIYTPSGVNFTLVTKEGSFEISSKLNGLFNVYNILGSIAACYAEGISIQSINNSLKSAKEIEGRFQIISSNQNESPICIVDYAHTPDGLENILNAARLMVKPGNKLICVFGCGGDRDPTKRPKMGKIAEKLSDITIITSDNPRSEDPNQIISDILSGLENTSNVMVEPDRKSAIETAIKKALKNDIVVIAGKGHEDYQILKDKTIHFDDREEVRKILEKI